MKCGIETIATASLVPIERLKTGVMRLPIPKPATDAIPAAIIDTMRSRMS